MPFIVKKKVRGHSHINSYEKNKCQNKREEIKNKKNGIKWKYN